MMNKYHGYGDITENICRGNNELRAFLKSIDCIIADTAGNKRVVWNAGKHSETNISVRDFISLAKNLLDRLSDEGYSDKKFTSPIMPPDGYEEQIPEGYDPVPASKVQVKVSKQKSGHKKVQDRVTISLRGDVFERLGSPAYLSIETLNERLYFKKSSKEIGGKKVSCQASRRRIEYRANQFNTHNFFGEHDLKYDPELKAYYIDGDKSGRQAA